MIPPSEPPSDAGAERKMEIARRLREVRQKLLISQTMFAIQIGISQSRLARYESEKDPLPWHVGERLCLIFGINPNWLAVGAGEMFGNSPEMDSMLREPRGGARLHFATVMDELLVRSAGKKELSPPVHRAQREGEPGIDFQPHALRPEMAAMQRVITRAQLESWSKFTHTELRAAYASIRDDDVEKFTATLKELLHEALRRHRRSHGP